MPDRSDAKPSYLRRLHNGAAEFRERRAKGRRIAPTTTAARRALAPEAAGTCVPSDEMRAMMNGSKWPSLGGRYGGRMMSPPPPRNAILRGAW
jgi:hypothetical protein